MRAIDGDELYERAYTCRETTDAFQELIASMPPIEVDGGLTSKRDTKTRETFLPAEDEEGLYWKRVCRIQKSQAEKGLKKYGQRLEDNDSLSEIERLEYLEEELIDGLMYIEHIKEKWQEQESCDIYEETEDFKRGYNYAKREIALSGEYERAFQRGYDKAKAEKEPCGGTISRRAVEDKLLRLVNELEEIFADIREKNVDDSVCGLCEYDCDHGIDGSAFECPGFERDDCFKLSNKIRREWQHIELPTVNPEEVSDAE